MSATFDAPRPRPATRIRVARPGARVRPKPAVLGWQSTLRRVQQAFSRLGAPSDGVRPA